LKQENRRLKKMVADRELDEIGVLKSCDVSSRRAFAL
jgi:hypothetical protein